MSQEHPSSKQDQSSDDVERANAAFKAVCEEFPNLKVYFYRTPREQGAHFRLQRPQSQVEEYLHLSGAECRTLDASATKLRHWLAGTLRPVERDIMETPIPRNLIAGELQVFAGYNYGDLFRWRIEGEEFIAVPVDSEVDLPEFRAKLYRTPAERTTFGPPLKKWAQDLHAAWALINERRVTHAKEIAQSVEAQRIATERRNQVRFRRAIEGWFKDQPNHVAGLRRIRDREVFIDDFGDCITDGWREKLREYVQKKMPVRDLLPEGCSTTMTYVNEVVDEVVTELIGEPTPSPILSAPGKALEESCESIARAAGFEIARRGGPGDQGADLVLVCGPRRVVIQCKFRDGSSVSNGAVQEVAAARAFYDAQHAIVVSNAVFTTSARQLARRLDVTLAAEAELQDVLMSLFRPA